MRLALSEGKNVRRALHDIQEVNDRAAWKFVPQPYDGPITLFKPHKNYSFMPDPRMGWGKLVQSSLEIVELPFNPHAMLIEPFVTTLGREIKSRVPSQKWAN